MAKILNYNYFVIITKSELIKGPFRNSKPIAIGSNPVCQPTPNRFQKLRAKIGTLARVCLATTSAVILVVSKQKISAVSCGRPNGAVSLSNLRIAVDFVQYF